MRHRCWQKSFTPHEPFLGRALDVTLLSAMSLRSKAPLAVPIMKGELDLDTWCVSLYIYRAQFTR